MEYLGQVNPDAPQCKGTFINRSFGANEWVRITPVIQESNANFIIEDGEIVLPESGVWSFSVSQYRIPTNPTPSTDLSVSTLSLGGKVHRTYIQALSSSGGEVPIGTIQNKCEVGSTAFIMSMFRAAQAGITTLPTFTLVKVA